MKMNAQGAELILPLTSFSAVPEAVGLLFLLLILG